MKLAIAALVVCASLALGPAPAAQGAGEEDYRIGPEDQLQIQVWGRPDLTGPVTVDYAGNIQLPLIGGIEAGGRTTADLSGYLTQRFQLLDPSIPEAVVSVLQYNSRSFMIVGEVRTPGRHAFRTIPDLWSAILASGGPTSQADLAHVQLARKEPRRGEPRAITVDLSAGVGETPLEALPELRPQDTIIVPSLVGGAVTGEKIQVLGAVNTPGVYRMTPNQRVTEAISLSGGFLADADLRRVSLTRTTGYGAISYQLDLRGYLHRAHPPANLELMPGDIVTVPAKRSTLASIIDGLATMAPIISLTFGLGLALR